VTRNPKSSFEDFGNDEVEMNSVVDAKLAKYGFLWEIDPCRIMDEKTGRAMVISKYFDLTDFQLQMLREKADRIYTSRFKKSE
jgi:hypothetical protein